jgi:exosortase
MASSLLPHGKVPTQKPDRSDVLAAVAMLSSALVLYWPILRDLASDWYHDANYSHGFLIVPAVVWIIWRDRAALRRLPQRPTASGLFVVLTGLVVLFVGTLGAEWFLTRVSLLIVLVGMTMFLFGTGVTRRLAFPYGLLVLMIPLPAIVFNQIAFPLQLLASRLGVLMLRLGDIPVLREGNVIILSNTTLEVAEACSGIRSLVSLLTLGVLYGYVSGYGPLRRLFLASLTVPIAIAANAIRVAGAGVTASWYGPVAVEGFLHSFSGWLTFSSSLVMLLAIDRSVSLMARESAVRVQQAELARS